MSRMKVGATLKKIVLFIILCVVLLVIFRALRIEGLVIIGDGKIVQKKYVSS